MKLRTVIATATTAAVLATSGVAIAGASDNAASPPPPARTSASAGASATRPATVRAHARARRLRLRRLLRGGADVVTKAIGIDRATLRQDLAAGQTIAEIATANHVEPKVVIDALVAAAKSKLDAAVTAGKITADRAAKIEARLPDRVTNLVNNWHPKRLRSTTAS